MPPRLPENPAWYGVLGALAIAVAAAPYVPYPYVAQYGRYALVAAHVLLFVGATYLLSHLLPRRAADEMA